MQDQSQVKEKYPKTEEDPNNDQEEANKQESRKKDKKTQDVKWLRPFR
jgi:hypothetical protein